ncbi:MAG: MBOAT family protein [Bacilli bacterium]|nr:MBOAT family protein [Bacilli bacterium]
MEFSSLLFLFIFFPIFIFSYFIFKNRTYRNIILLIFSLFFYAWGEPIYILLMILSIIVNYFLAIFIDKYNKKAKLILLISIIFNIGLLIIFKYTDFLIDSFNLIFDTDMQRQNIALPIGISFYTFQVLSYVIDVYWKKVNVQKNILFLGCYITAFPQLIAGPIVKYSTVEKELINRNENIEETASGIRLFIRGLAKKVIIANNVGFIADSILLLSPNEYGFIGSLVAMVSYTLQIYFDFSGYSDMAIGMGRMLGFHFDKNFDYPYISKSITEFWRRWHISLSTWFKEYVYIPLGGNRVGKLRLILNILIVWILTGIWHGASFNFLLWGLFYGIILLVEKLVLGKILKKLPNALKHIYVIIVVIIGWTIFRNESIVQIKNVLSSLIGVNGLGDFNIFIFTQTLSFKYIIAFVLGIVFSTPILSKIFTKFKTIKYFDLVLDILIIIVFILCIINLVSGSYNPFIYFRF